MIKLLILIVTLGNALAEDVIWLPRNSKIIKNQINANKINEFSPYLNDFKLDIQLTADQSKRFESVKIRVLDFDEPQLFYGNAICNYKQNEILISHNKWIVSSENEKQQLIDHELGHCIFGRIHIHQFKSIMNINGFDYEKENKKQLRTEFSDKRLWNQIQTLTQRIKNIKDPNKIKQIEIDLIKKALK